MRVSFRVLKAILAGKRNSRKRIILSIVAAVEIIAILTVATYAWVETISSIKIEGQGIVRDILYTDADIGENGAEIDLAYYFREASRSRTVGGNTVNYPTTVHLAPASSQNGTDFFFPANTGRNNTVLGTVNSYRAGNVSDRNANYFSVSFRIRTSSNADFFFNGTPTVPDDIRVSVTAQSEGQDNAQTTVYANSASTAAVVNSVSGSTGAADVKKFSDHVKGKASEKRIFNVTAEETKLVTVNIWLQKKSNDLNSNMAQSIAISNLKIISSLTPRHVTLVPTGVWDASSPSFYAYMWTGDNHKWYDLKYNGNGSYSFDYDGTYQTLTFVRSREGADHTFDPNSGFWNQTEDLTIPASPVDPTFFVTSMSGGADSKSAGVWFDPAVIKIHYANGSNSSMGTIGLEAKLDNVTQTEVTGEGTVLYRTATGSTATLTSTQTANTDYRFDGWFTDPDCSGTPLVKLDNIVPTAGDVVNYYAKFTRAYNVKLQAVLEGSNATEAIGTLSMKAEGTTNSQLAASLTKKYPEGTTVEFSATAAAGYTYNGISATQTGNTSSTLTEPVGTKPITRYALFTANSYDVTAHSVINGSSTDTNTCGTVNVGGTGAGATSVKSVKYKNTVQLVAEPASNYEFVGWYTAATGGSEIADSSHATYTYTLNTAGDVDVYARFIRVYTTTVYITPRKDWTSYYLRAYGNGGVSYTSGTNAFAQASYDNTTGYYKVEFTTSVTGDFWAILSKNDNANYGDGKYPQTGGYKGTIGNTYRFKSDQNGDLPAFESNRRCLWFIDGTSTKWIKTDWDNQNNQSTMILYCSGTTTNYNMTRQDTYSWIVEVTGLSGDLYFKECQKSNTGNIWNEWKTTQHATRSQYTATDNEGAGSWGDDS